MPKRITACLLAAVFMFLCLSATAEGLILHLRNVVRLLPNRLPNVVTPRRSMQ